MADEMQTTMGRDAPDGGNGLLGALLSNPAMLGSLLSGLSANTASAAGEGEAAPAAAEKKEGDAVPAAVSEGIGAVLSNPDMMAKLPEVMQMIKPLMGAMSAPAGGESGGERESVAAGAKPHEGGKGGHGGGGGGSHCHDKRIALLKALRPYMSPRRQEVIDYILRMDKMGTLFRNG